MNTYRALTRLTAFSILFIFSTGCYSTAKRNPVPAPLIQKVGIADTPEARFWGDEWPKFSVKKFDSYTNAEFQKYYSGVYNTEHNYLAISGGGANGAFGAGLFAGWSDSGKRPEFTMVTGISTGALTAPFAFLGKDYDALLKDIYTSTSTEDILTERGILEAAFTDAMANTKPLKRLIAKHVTAEVLEAIGEQHKRGRRLFIGTVNLEAGRSVIWNIGAIALSDNPDKLELTREIMRASAAIPVAFPPVAIPVETASGEKYDELHVDGGTGTQVFVYPAAIDWHEITQKLKVKGTPNVYVIRNSFLDPDYQGITRSVLPIASRSIESLIRTQGVGDLYQIYALCDRDGNDFNLAYIPSDFIEKPTEGFDPVYMTKLWQRGYELAKNGYDWKKGPPGFVLE